MRYRYGKERFAPSTSQYVDQPRMKVICAWCKSVLIAGEGPVSHGICDECAAEHFAPNCR